MLAEEGIIAWASVRPRLADLLRRVGACQRSHTGRRLTDHLEATGSLLDAWGAPGYLSAAGMLHSIYGTNAFIHACLEPTAETRQLVAEAAGPSAERLAYLFCISERPTAFLEAASSFKIVSRFDGGDYQVTRQEQVDLLVMECANLAEQGDFILIRGLARLAQAQAEAMLGARHWMLDGMAATMVAAG